MSQYVVLLTTLSLDEPLYALTTSSNPAAGISILQDYCPVPLELLHTISTGNSTDNLIKTLRIKFHSQLSHSFWYNLNPEQVAFIQTITTENFRNIIGLIHKAERKADLNQDEVNELLAESLKKAEGALT